MNPYDDPTLPQIELGASIFVDANKNIMRAVEEFKLPIKSNGDPANGMGIWDGEEFVVEVSDESNLAWLATRFFLRVRHDMMF